MAKFCKNCGAQLDDDMDFCTECGTKFGEIPKQNYNSSNNPFSRYNIDMINGETIIRSSQIHIGCLYIPAIITGLGLFLGIISLIAIASYSYYFYPRLILIPFMHPLFIIGLIWLIIRYIGYKNNDLILTNKRIFGKCGMITIKVIQSPLSKIDSVSFNQGIFGKLIGYGSVEIYTTSSKFNFRFIKDGQLFYNDIFNQLENSEKEKNVKNAEIIVEAFSKKMD